MVLVGVACGRDEDARATRREEVVCVMSGGNIDRATLTRILS